jgi:hypothetical protein
MMDDELRPSLSIEVFTPRMRWGLLMLTLFEELLLVLLVLSMAIWPSGVLDMNSAVGVMAIGVWISLAFFLLLIYGGLVLNNPRHTPASRTFWLAAFLLAGPISVPWYWALHLLRAPRDAWTETDEPQPVRPAKAAPT